MPYGTIKVDTITFTDGGVDKSVAISGLVQNPTFTGNVTVTGTVSGATVRATTVSGVTISGTTVNAASGVFTTQISGAVVVAPAGLVGTPSVQVGTGATVAPGLYGAGTDQLGVSTGGSSRLVVDSVGQIRVVTLGSAAAPALVVGNDLNTGLYSPGADQVALSTAGIGRLFVDASGNVGIGTSLPVDKLHVDGRIAVTTDSSTPTTGEAFFYKSSSGAVMSGFSASLETGSAGSRQERLRITSDGKVGIGTTAPGAIFHAQSSGGPVGIFYYAGGSLGAPTTNTVLTLRDISFGNTTTTKLNFIDSNAFENGFIAVEHNASVNAAASLTFATASGNSGATERLRITSDGKVGIGTSSPNRLFESSAAGVDNFIRVNTTGATKSGIEFASGGTVYSQLYFNNVAPYDLSLLQQYSTGSLILGTNNTERARITSDGKVGIGTSSPALPLHVVGAMASRNTTAGMDNMSLAFSETGSGNAYGVRIGQKANAVLAFEKYDGGWAETARIDSSGRLLVGTSSARGTFFGSTVTPQLQLEATTQQASSLSLTNSVAADGGSILVFGKQRSGAVGGNTVVNSGDELGQISFQGSDGTKHVIAAGIQAFVDGTPGANDMPGRLVFSTTADGASTPTERMRLDNKGTFTVFSSTANVIGAASNQAAGTTYYLFYGANNSSSTTTGATCFLVYTNGNVQNTNNSYAGISDIKLKENIVDASSQWSDIKALQVRKYNFKEGQTHTQIGLVAQEVELVSPGLVSESPDRDAEGNDLGTVTKSVNYSVLYMKAVKALQEAMERIETLEAKVAALESK